MVEKNIKLEHILGRGNEQSDDEDISRKVEIREAPRSRVSAGTSWSVSPLKQAKRSACDRPKVDVNDELSVFRMIGIRVRKFVFTDKVAKVASEFLLRCVSEYKEQMMRMIAKKRVAEWKIRGMREAFRTVRCE